MSKPSWLSMRWWPLLMLLGCLFRYNVLVLLACLPACLSLTSCPFCLPFCSPSRLPSRLPSCLPFCLPLCLPLCLPVRFPACLACLSCFPFPPYLPFLLAFLVALILALILALIRALNPSCLPSLPFLLSFPCLLALPACLLLVSKAGWTWGFVIWKRLWRLSALNFCQFCDMGAELLELSFALVWYNRTWSQDDHSINTITPNLCCHLVHRRGHSWGSMLICLLYRWQHWPACWAHSRRALNVLGGNMSLTSYTCHGSGSRWSTQAGVVWPQHASHTAHGIKHNASQSGT